MIIRIELKIAVLLFLSQIIVGCATKLGIDPVTTRFDVPETEGKGQLGLSVFVSESPELVLATASDSIFSDSTVFVDNENRIERDLVVGTNGSYGLGDRIDVFVRANTYGPYVFGVKTDWLGKYFRILNSSLRFSNSIFLGQGKLFQQSHSKGDILLEENVSGEVWDISANVGFRFSKKVIVYINTFYSEYRYGGNITQNGQVIVRDDSQGTTIGSMLGVRYDFDNLNSLILEGGVTEINWIHYQTTRVGTAGLSLRMPF